MTDEAADADEQTRIAESRRRGGDLRSAKLAYCADPANRMPNETPEQAMFRYGQRSDSIPLAVAYWRALP